MSLIWKLLRQHISGLQLLGFFLANLVGMLIVLFAVQFYRDVRPVFTQDEGLIPGDYIILSKRISAVGLGNNASFTEREIKDIKEQSFCKRLGGFTASQYKVNCYAGIEGVANFGTQMYFEAVPDEYVDTQRDKWHWEEGNPFVPIILPKSYLAIYNFGFAQSRSLPKLSEGVVSMIDMTLSLRGEGKEHRLRGRVIGFTNRLNTILVPESFIRWSNQDLAPHADVSSTRLIMEVKNPTDPQINDYVQQHGYDIDEDKLQAGKTTYFLKIMTTVVACVGLLISLLSFFILMLSIYLLVQKNSKKFQTLMLLGYSSGKVSLPYQLLTILLNAFVLLLALGLLYLVRQSYMNILWNIFPTMKEQSLLPAIILGILLFLLVSVLNSIAIRRKIEHSR